MSDEHDLARTIEAVRVALTDVDAATIEQSPRSTIVPPGARSAGDVSVERDLELLETIGQGGMATVRRGLQRSLEREVAIKGLKPDQRSASSVSKLVREARVTGGLEHPNVVPVYEIAKDDEGTPLIVLKKIEGVNWGVLMHDRDAVRERFGTDDPLEWNLRVLVQVCDAVRFAHNRGVLHRDLKPENVMIGAFGEVYVLDWGIAVGLDERMANRLPLASEAHELAGTPVYMAPEMLGGRVSRLSERTDVYLLGSIAYEIVSGRPPHDAQTFADIVASIVESSPPLPASVPAELAQIIQRALDADPDARFERVEQLRLAIGSFLAHRGAAQLVERAEERLASLVALLDQPGLPDDLDHIYRLYGECRFGLRHALEAWPENDSIQRSLELATRRMVELELARDDPQAARTLLRDLDLAPEDLEARVARASLRKERELDELRGLREYLDPGSGRRVRALAMAALAGLWVLWPLGVQLARTLDPAGFTTGVAALVTAVTFAGVLAVIYLARRIIWITIINRRLAFAVALTSFSGLVLIVDAWISNESSMGTVEDMLLIAMAIVASLAAGFHRSLYLPATGYLVGYLTTRVIGVESALYVTSAANSLLFLTLYGLMRRLMRAGVAGPDAR
jgi:serine/threonine-protein kinase